MTTRTLWRQIRRNRWPYLFILPFYLSFAVFMLFPIVYSLVLGFQKWDGIGAKAFVGIDNYRNLLGDQLFWKSLWNTTYITLWNIPLQLGLALLLAVALNSAFLRFRKGFRMIYFMPIVTSVVVVSIVFKLLYDTHFGLLNWALETLGLPSIPWTSSEQWSKLALLFLITWRWTGYNMVIMLAGLQSIPKELYEASRIDGATKSQALGHITIPLLKPVLLFCLIMSIIGLFQIFTEPYVLTGGGPNDSSQTIVLYLYQHAFRYRNLGYASSIAYALFLIIFAFSLLNVRLFGNSAAD